VAVLAGHFVVQFLNFIEYNMAAGFNAVGEAFLVAGVEECAAGGVLIVVTLEASLDVQDPYE
jgi:hypothetical protein